MLSIKIYTYLLCMKGNKWNATNSRPYKVKNDKTENLSGNRYNFNISTSLLIIRKYSEMINLFPKHFSFKDFYFC